MMQAKDRKNLYTTLGEKLEQTGRRTREDVDAIKALLADETESMEKARARLKSRELTDSSRKAHETGIANREHAIAVLKDVLQLFRDKDNHTAGKLLKTLGATPGRKATRTSSVWTDYQEYLTHTDTDFHRWLKDQGKHTTLQTLGVAQ